MKKRKALAVLSLALFAPLLFSCQNSTEGEREAPTFTLTASVEELGEKILIDVTQGEYASGTYLMIVSDKTEISNADGKSLEKEDIRVGDVIAVTYSGQVMMSYPAQIVAQKIQIQ